jgi:hypothetical protein
MEKFDLFEQPLPYSTPGRMYHPDEWCAHCGRSFRKHATRVLAAEHIARVVATERGIAFDPKAVGDIRDLEDGAYSAWRKTVLLNPAPVPSAATGPTAGQPGSLGKTPAVPPSEGSPQHGYQPTGLPRPEEPRWTSITGQKPADKAAASNGKPIDFYRDDVEKRPPEEKELTPARIAEAVEKIRKREALRRKQPDPYRVTIEGDKK